MLCEETGSTSEFKDMRKLGGDLRRTKQKNVDAAVATARNWSPKIISKFDASHRGWFLIPGDNLYYTNPCVCVRMEGVVDWNNSDLDPR
jgi:hypothetical protein